MTEHIMSRNEMISLQKAILWEAAKGKLRAVVAAGGQCRPDDRTHGPRWRELSEAVEDFIKDIEDNALQE